MSQIERDRISQFFRVSQDRMRQIRCQVAHSGFTTLELFRHSTVAGRVLGRAPRVVIGRLVALLPTVVGREAMDTPWRPSRPSRREEVLPSFPSLPQSVPQQKGIFAGVRHKKDVDGYEEDMQLAKGITQKLPHGKPSDATPKRGLI